MSAPAPQSAPRHADLIERYRADRKSLPLHPAEKRLLWILGAHLCFLPWALGTMHAWSQVTSLVLAFIGFVVAALPRTYSGDYALPVNTGPKPGPELTSVLSPPSSVHRAPRHSSAGATAGPPLASPQLRRSDGGSSALRLHPWSRLLRFPIFWLGLALLAYIAVQGFNPSWIWERSATHWWLRRVNDIEWLPTSVDTPWERFNLWRQFIIYASAWLVACSLWIGVTRRRSIALLLSTLAVNAVVHAIAGVIFRMQSPWWVLGYYQVGVTANPFAGFVYHNHAGAYFALMTATAGVLVIWSLIRGSRLQKKSTPSGLYALFCLILFLIVLQTHSRGASITVILFIVVSLAWLVVTFRRKPLWGNDAQITLVMLLMIICVLGYCVSFLDFSTVLGKFDRLIVAQTKEESIHSRLLAHDSAKSMLRDSWPRGVGAGGFRYLFPEYIKEHPEIYQSGRLFWEHAHNDWLQVAIELGFIGFVLLASGAGWWVRTLFLQQPKFQKPPLPASDNSHFSTWRSPAFILTLGCMQTLLHAWFDFPFQNPAILITWLAMMIFALRWVEVELGN